MFIFFFFLVVVVNFFFFLSPPPRNPRARAGSYFLSNCESIAKLQCNGVESAHSPAPSPLGEVDHWHPLIHVATLPAEAHQLTQRWILPLGGMGVLEREGEREREKGLTEAKTTPTERKSAAENPGA